MVEIIKDWIFWFLSLHFPIIIINFNLIVHTIIKILLKIDLVSLLLFRNNRKKKLKHKNPIYYIY